MNCINMVIKRWILKIGMTLFRHLFIILDDDGWRRRCIRVFDALSILVYIAFDLCSIVDFIFFTILCFTISKQFLMSSLKFTRMWRIMTYKVNRLSSAGGWYQWITIIIRLLFALVSKFDSRTTRLIPIDWIDTFKTVVVWFFNINVNEILNYY